MYLTYKLINLKNGGFMKQKWSQIENKQRFSIKKLSVGVASVSIGFFITGVPMVQADTSGEGLSLQLRSQRIWIVGKILR